MADTEKEMAGLRTLCANADLWTEGGAQHVFLPAIQFMIRGGQKVVRDLLLRPSAANSYTTRLYLSEPVVAPDAKNWTSTMVGGRTWHVCSWNQVPADMPWIEMVAAHLRAFK